jgi:hypothetical protein
VKTPVPTMLAMTMAVAAASEMRGGASLMDGIIGRIRKGTSTFFADRDEGGPSVRIVIRYSVRR